MRVGKALTRDEYYEVRRVLNDTDNIDFDRVLNLQVRQVRWLYNNAGKCSGVYDEKLVRLMIQRLKRKIKDLEEAKNK